MLISDESRVFLENSTRYAKSIPKFWRSAGICLAFFFLAGLCTLLVPYVLTKGLGSFADKEPLLALGYCAAFFAVRLVQDALSAYAKKTKADGASLANQTTLARLYRKVLEYPLRTVDAEKRTGQLLQKLVDTWRIGDSFYEVFVISIGLILQTAITLMVIGYFSTSVGIICASLFFVSLWIGFGFTRQLNDYTERALGQLAALGGVMHEGIASIIPIKSMGAVDAYLSQIDSESHALVATEFERNRSSATIQLSTTLSNSGLQILALGYIFYQGMSDYLGIPETIALAYLSIRVFGVSRSLAISMQEARRCQVLFSRMYALLDHPVEGSDQTGDVRLRLQSAPRISFRNLCFGYGKNLLFHGFDLEIAAGERIAIVGKSGAGKSSLLKLLLGLYQPKSGSICIDDMRLTQLDLQYFRSRIGLILQGQAAFPGTVRDNLLFGHPEPISDDRLWKALEKAALVEKVSKSKEGLDQWVKGSLWSGGENQRLMLARALARDAQLMIFDEPTSALDTETERFIRQSLSECARDSTQIIVAHRLETVMQSDRIVVLDNGAIKEAGTHSELQALKGAYYSYYRNSTLGA